MNSKLIICFFAGIVFVLSLPGLCFAADDGDFQLFKQVKADVFYLWQSSEKSEKWNDSHVLGTELGFSF